MLLTACTEAVDNAVEVNKLPAIFPDYCGVAIPANIAPMNFNVTDNVDKVDVTVKGSKEGMIHNQGDYADFDIDEWHDLVGRNKGGELTFSVCTKKDGRWYRYKDFTMEV